MIRKIEEKDLKFLNENIAFFYKNPINLDDIKKHPFSKYYVYLIDNKIVGFINFSIIYDKGELNYIWVCEKYRHKKIATKLMNFMIEKCKDLINITLEVNTTNNIAIKLYKKYGFKKVALRKNYYGNNDAILMLREMI